MLKIVRTAILPLIALAACAAPTSDTPDSPAISGYCPAAYSLVGKAVPGKPDLSAEYRGKTWYFAAPGALEKFQANPEAHSVAYDGECATAVALGKFDVPSDPKVFHIEEIGGVKRTFLFGNEEMKQLFLSQKSKHIADADNNWASHNG